MKNNGVFYNIKMVAELCGVSRQSIYNRIEAGEFSNRVNLVRGQSVPAKDVWESRKLERDKLVERLDELDRLDMIQYELDEKSV